MTPSDLKKETSLVDEVAVKLLSLASGVAVDAAEVCLTYTQSSKVILEKQDFHIAAYDGGYRVGLRVLHGEQQGFASTNSIDSNDLRLVAQKASQIAKLSPKNPFITIASGGNIPQEAPNQLWDEGLTQVSLQTQRDWASLLINEATRDSRFRLNEGELNLTSQIFLVANSTGVHKSERETRLTWSLMGMGVDGEVITSFDYFTELSRTQTGVVDRIASTTKRFCKKVLQNLKQGPAHSYKGLVVFSPRAIVDIFLDAIAFQLNGRNVIESTTRWKPEQVGKTVLSDTLTVVDNPWLRDRFGCAVFDREGTPTRVLTVIDKGRLATFLCDHYSAKGLKMNSTGHAAGGPTSLPTVSPHTWVVSPGLRSDLDLLKEVAQTQTEFLVVDRFSGQTDPVTGDFSGVAKGGQWFRGGERAYCVKETLISGNVYDALGTGLFGVSQNTSVVDSDSESPTLVVDSVSVTGQ